MKKVIIEITEGGWITTIKDGDFEIIEKHLSTPSGSRCVEGNFENEDSISDELYAALSGYYIYDIMRALR
jgi:hypothetical protein